MLRFFSMKVKMMDLWMQIEGTKLIFIINISVLDFFKFASRMPQIAQILVSTLKIFRRGGGMPPDPPTPLEISSFFPWAIPGSDFEVFLGFLSRMYTILHPDKLV